MMYFRPVLLLGVLVLLQVAFADDLKCHTCPPDGKCNDKDSGREAGCPESKYCIVDVALEKQTKPIEGEEGAGPYTYYRKCGPKGDEAPADKEKYKKENDDLMCMNGNIKKSCYCTKKNCNKMTPQKGPKGNSHAVNNVAKATMVMVMGLVAFMIQ